MEQPPVRQKIHPLSIVAAIILAAVILGLATLLLRLTAPEAPKASNPPVYNVTLIPAPTETPVLTTPTLLATATLSDPNVLLPAGTMGFGAYVRITGTEGLGLRIRSAAGISAGINFLAMDEEVFRVIGGPVDADGYLWWQLEAPYDKTRSGWAAESYLQVIDLLTPTP